MNKNPIDIFKKEAPDLANTFFAMIEELKNLKGLDEKTKHLIYIGMKIALDDEIAIKFHVPMAKQCGATREEIKDCILISLSVLGLKAISKYFTSALEIYDKS